jgi:hypothetical protein
VESQQRCRGGPNRRRRLGRTALSQNRIAGSSASRWGRLSAAQTGASPLSRRDRTAGVLKQTQFRAAKSLASLLHAVLTSAELLSKPRPAIPGRRIVSRPAAASQRRIGGAGSRVRPHCRFRHRGTECVC